MQSLSEYVSIKTINVQVAPQLTAIIAFLIHSMPEADDVEIGLTEEPLHLIILTVEDLVVCDMLQLVSQGSKFVLDSVKEARKPGKTLICYAHR
jgi:hypothetical protein